MQCENLGVAHPKTHATADRPQRSAPRSAHTQLRARNALAAIATVWTFAQPREAAAAFEYRLTATGSATYTDNLNSAADDPPPDSGVVGREAGFLFAINPGATIGVVEPRGQLTLGYSRPMVYTTSDVVASSSTDALVGAAVYQPSELDNVGLSAALTRSTLTPFLFNGQSPGAVTGLNNAGNEELLRGQVNEFWTREWSESWSSQQNTSFGTQIDLEGDDLPNTRVLSNALTLRLDHRYGAFTLGATATSTELGATATSTELGGPTSTWAHLVTGTLGWAREVDPLTNVALVVGVSKTLSDTPPQLVGSATLSQARDFTTWSVSIARNQNADLQTGRIFSSESALASIATAPFEATQLSFVAGGGASRFTAVGTIAYAGQAFASLNFTHEYFVSSLSYTFLHQISEGNEINNIPSLTRNAITLTVGAVFPAE